MSRPTLSSPDEVRLALVPSSPRRWWSVATMDDALSIVGRGSQLEAADFSPEADESDRISQGGLGLHTDGYPKVPVQGVILLPVCSRPVEIRVLGVADVLAALRPVTGDNGIVRQLAGSEVLVDPGATTARGNLFRLAPDGMLGNAVVSEGTVQRWVELWRSLASDAPAVRIAAGQTVAVHNRLAARARVVRTGPGVRLRRMWLVSRTRRAS